MHWDTSGAKLEYLGKIAPKLDGELPIDRRQSTPSTTDLSRAKGLVAFDGIVSLRDGGIDLDRAEAMASVVGH